MGQVQAKDIHEEIDRLQSYPDRTMLEDIVLHYMRTNLSYGTVHVGRYDYNHGDYKAYIGSFSCIGNSEMAAIKGLHKIVCAKMDEKDE
jgi:hypothetical protein